MLLLSVRWPFFAAGMVFGALTNGLAFFILSRMGLLGHQVGIWRTHKDWALYREYWRVAPARNWSRAPIIAGIVSFVRAACFLCLSINGGASN
jgi:hypothetical protein